MWQWRSFRSRDRIELTRDYFVLPEIQKMRMTMPYSCMVEPSEHDIYTVSNTKESDIYIVESYAGGIGIVKKITEKWRDVLRERMRIARNCSCRLGCPYCIVPPRRTEEIDKFAGLMLAEQLLQVASRSPSHEFIKGTWKPL